MSDNSNTKKQDKILKDIETNSTDTNELLNRIYITLGKITSSINDINITMKNIINILSFIVMINSIMLILILSIFLSILAF